VSAPRYEIGYGGPVYRPLWRKLRRRLLAAGGVECFGPRPHLCNLERLLSRGVFLTPAGVRSRIGRKADCHGNVRRLARIGERRAYGLTLAGTRWLEHSWLVAPDGCFIETTLFQHPSTNYFGIVSRCPVRVEKKVAKK
jgi:hypothetical protein